MTLVATRFAPQLAESTGLDQLPALCENDDWLMAQKLDGRRLAALVDDGDVRGLNRRGEPVSIPDAVAAPFRQLKGRWTFDGELMPTGEYILFDMPEAIAHVDLGTPYAVRRRALDAIYAAWKPGRPVRLLHAAWTHEEKVALAKRIVSFRGEGMMLNHRDGLYQPGKRNKHLLKVKLTKTLDAVVVERGVEKQNLTVGVYRSDGTLVCFEVTALAGDGPTLQPGEVCEVTYLGASANGRLIQLTTPVRRQDKRPEECTFDQLEYSGQEIVDV